MKCPDYLPFMDCYNEMEALYRTTAYSTIICACLYEQEMSGSHYTAADVAKAVQEAERRLALSRDKAYVNSLFAWALEVIERKTGKQSEEHPADQ